MRYYSPGAAGDGMSVGTPANFSAETLRKQLAGAAGANNWTSGQTNITLVFQAGTHTNVVIKSQVWSGSPLAPRPQSNLVFRIVGSGSRPDSTVLLFAKGYNAGYGESGYDTTAPISLGLGNGHSTQLYQMVVSNLTVDCNWKEQPVLNSPAYSRGYRLAAISGFARYGHITKVICRDTGSHGLVPGSRWDSSAGVECFPILCYGVDVGQEPLAGFPRPWLIEDVEALGFNTVYDGYGTTLSCIGTESVDSSPAAADWLTPADLYNTASRRFALVRACQLRDGVIGFGVGGRDPSPGWAASGTTYAGNAVLNHGMGHNSDSGEIHALDQTNSVFLDVSTVLNHGTPQSGAIYGRMWNFNASGNLARLGDRYTFPLYRDYKATSYATWPPVFASDSTLLLGYRVTNEVSGIRFSGPSSNTIIALNQFTTRPFPRFYRPDPGNSSLSVWRPVWKVADGVADVPYDAGQVRLASDFTNLGTNYVSSSATDFRSLLAMADDDTYSPFTSATAPDQTGQRAALASATNFVMFGRTERIEMTHSNVTQSFSWVRRTLTYGTNGAPTATNISTITSNFTARVLARVRELQIGEPNLATNNSVSIAVRLVDHATPYVGGGSTYVNGATVRLQASGAHTAGPLVQTTDANGIAIFTYSLGGVPDGLDALLAWWDGPNSVSTNLDTYSDVYASARVTNGVVISVVAAPDVAEDNDALGTRQKGQFRLRRSGPLNSPLTVRYQVATNYDYPRFTGASLAWDFENNINAATSTMNAAATYGSGTGQDYTLSAVTPATMTTPSGYPFAGTVIFAANQGEAVVEVIPKQDEMSETNLVALWLLSSSTNTYALGPQTNATVYVYDGPEWTVYPITDSSAATKATGINNDTNTVISGRRWYVQYPYSGWDGGYWNAGALGTFSRMYCCSYLPGYTPEPNGVSDTLGGAIRFCGYFGAGSGTPTVAWRGWANNIDTLSPLTSGKPAEARAVQTNAANAWVTVGWSDKTVSGSTVRRPVKWLGSATAATDMGSLGGSSTERGEAWSLARGGATAGWSQYTLSGTVFTRAFATLDDDTLTGPLTDSLQPPQGSVSPVSSDATRSSAAVYVNDLRQAAGYWTDTSDPLNVVAFPVVWTPTVTTLDRLPNDQQGDATVITISGRIFGRSSATSPANGSAVYWHPGTKSPVKLTDSHFFGGTSGWSFSRVNSANALDTLAGSGTLSGVEKGFVMVRRVGGN